MGDPQHAINYGTLFVLTNRAPGFWLELRDSMFKVTKLPSWSQFYLSATHSNRQKRLYALDRVPN
jgi:hypothetical protein